MNMFLLNILLAVLWMFMWGSFHSYSLLMGMVLGYLLLGIVSRTTAGDGYGARGWRFILFFIYFVRILVKANLIVAWEIITPGHQMTPGIIRYPIKGMTEFQITSLANAITLTPGTLSVDLDDQSDYLYVHCMYAKDRPAAIQDLDELKGRIMEVLT